MNVTEFGLASKSLINQLEKYDFSKGDKLSFDRDYFDEVHTCKKEAYYQVKSQQDVLNILSFFNIEPKVSSAHIDEIIKAQDLNITERLAFILRIA